MLFQFEDIKINVDSYKNDDHKTPLILLHGFSGSANDWKDIAPKINTSVYAIDLPGHGKTCSPDNSSLYNSENLVSYLDYIFEQLKIKKLFLLGYSMGGRAALTYALAFPNNIKGLIFESTSPGIQNADERNKRVNDDISIAKLIEEKGIEFFVEYWMNLPIFETQKKLSPVILNNIRKEKLKCNPVGLANSLRGFGTGIMPSYWNRLNELNPPVLLISGWLDLKYTHLAEQMKSMITHCEHTIVDGCGHNTHLEKPQIFIDLINDFLISH